LTFGARSILVSSGGESFNVELELRMLGTWYFAKAGKIHGPYSLAKLQSKFGGRDQKGIYVWCDGFVEWQPVEGMADFHDNTSERGT
jgi:hypothetical protein